MSDVPNVVLERLREIRGLLGELRADTGEIKERLGLLESQYASISRRVDRIGGDIELIRKREGLIDAPEGAA
jgi:hypothetical protein